MLVFVAIVLGTGSHGTVSVICAVAVIALCVLTIALILVDRTPRWAESNRDRLLQQMPA